ncbi:MAG: N-acetylmuramoyl-L-alanine amidase, partial [Elusimicrobia bacterium]|nr:N-acetylmuramoyl-L-alanine amidase [Elusimicrobiota bacterium]
QGAIENIPVVMSGKYAGTVQMYRVGKENYLNATDLGKIYGGHAYWYPVSGRVLMRFYGESLKFIINSDKATVGSQEVRLSSPVMVRASQAFIPFDFFLSKPFTGLVDMDTYFDLATRHITVEKRANIGSLRHFFYSDHSRVVVGMGSLPSFIVSPKGDKRVDILFPHGMITKAEKMTVADGLIHSLGLVQEKDVVRLTISLEQKPVRIVKNELKNPRRLALDLFRPESAISTVAAISPANPEEASAEKETSSESAPSAVIPPIPGMVSSEEPAISVVPGSVPQENAPPVHQSLRRRIVIDPGHGGKDSGADGRYGLVEKEVNLWVAKELARFLKEEGKFEVLLTRISDKFVPLSDRSQMATEFNADLFISIHANAHRDRRENGFEIYYLSEKPSDPSAASVAQFENASLELEGKTVGGDQADVAARLLGSMARNEFINEGGILGGLIAKGIQKKVDISNRGIKKAGFYVLSGTYAPAILIELGFLTNTRDASRLSNERFRKKMVSGIYTGILAYADEKNWFANGESSPGDK